MKKYKTVTKNVDKDVTKEMGGAVMASLYGSDEYLAKKSKQKTAPKKADKKKK